MSKERLFPDYHYDTPDDQEEYIEQPIFSESDSSDEYFIPRAPSTRAKLKSDRDTEEQPASTAPRPPLPATREPKPVPKPRNLQQEEVLNTISEETTSSDCTGQFYRE